MFKPVPTNVSFPKLERQVGRLWKDRRVYARSRAQRRDPQRFVFFEGPPTANGMPHPGHCLTRTIKDVFPRYRTMRGYRCQRKAGWDTHGLPVEVEVCKELGIHSKEEIEQYGIEPFIHRCQESVWRYMQEWQRLTERLGFWIHLDEAYVTYHQSYVESVWWSLKNLFDRGLLYQGHKIVWWWAQGGTALSAGEVGQGYREVADPSLFVRCPLLDDPYTALLVWTTTPWTLPSNQFVAVHGDLQYATVVDPEDDGRRLILAADLVDNVAKKVKRPLEVVATCSGKSLVGRRYTPPFDFYFKDQGSRSGQLRSGGREPLGWRVVAADFVTLASGTGLVHQAPAFGEVDFEILRAEQARFVDGEGPELICCVAPNGEFTDVAETYAGRWVKEADKDIARALRHRGLLYHQEQVIHDYPFCWRAEDDPLIQYPRKGWFVRTTQFKQKMLENNAQINWLPAHIRDGRFGNFLETNVDWALSRERYWGTPLPIWICEESGYQEAVASYDELLAKPGLSGTEVWEEAKRAKPELPEDLKVHKPYIDALTYDSPERPGARMRRVPEVIDCWYDAGAMPFAQWGYPQQGREEFHDQFPADFISEALDQTRGWFYSLLAISTLLLSDEESTDPERPPTPMPHPFRNCIVLGLILGEDGGKMSKRLRNYREPEEIFDRYGADAMRWYFLANQPPWTAIRYSEQAIRASIPEFLLRLWNVYSFFVIYARIDQFDPAAEIPAATWEKGPGQLTADDLATAPGYRPLADRSELDRWLLSELSRTAAGVVDDMDAYDNFGACQRIIEFVDGLSNWYVRRSRDRFWSGATRSTEKRDAYWTLYECLLTTSKLIAPFVPFLAEVLWQNLASEPFGDKVLDSVHLCDYPAGRAATVDAALSARMGLIREIASLGRSARMEAKLKVRQPLGKVEVILADPQQQAWLANHAALICEELNVKRVEFPRQADDYISYTVIPDFKRLGPRLGRQMPQVKKALAAADGSELVTRMKQDGQVRLDLPDGPVVLDADDLQIRLASKPGWTAAEGPQCVVVLATELTEPLRQEGLANELIRLIQDRRKDLQCDYTDRIEVGIVTDAEPLRAAAEAFADFIRQETLAARLVFTPLDGAAPAALKAADHELQLWVQVVSS
jgi:isoleucyl-tRNA synthetase